MKGSFDASTRAPSLFDRQIECTAVGADDHRPRTSRRSRDAGGGRFRRQMHFAGEERADDHTARADLHLFLDARRTS